MVDRNEPDGYDWYEPELTADIEKQRTQEIRIVCEQISFQVYENLTQWKRFEYCDLNVTVTFSNLV